MSRHGTSGNEVVERKTIKGTERTPWTLNGLIDHLGRQIGPIQIITCSSGILDIVPRLELLEAFCPSIVNILGVGDKLRRRSIGCRHFEWRTG